ncbi:hypothetical protein Ddye_016485 [Dipteronia dyeriana]|uniref:Mitochondrial inner membrane protease ATP23 n=1 Tax=Dipteronia dyeriana TaxID=168575 RepID=A0AAD9U7H8_9ROSI|nr:hypothetical protein Ddye_016485 [Dipteronia dyeriana]
MGGPERCILVPGHIEFLIWKVRSRRAFRWELYNKIGYKTIVISQVRGMAEEPASKPGSDNFSSAVNDSRTVEECQDMIQRSLKKIFEGAFGEIRIMMCSNHMIIKDEVSQVDIHELIHAYDDCRAANLNWANCAHHTCNSCCHLSGDCHYKRELLQGYIKIRGHEQTIGQYYDDMQTQTNTCCSKFQKEDYNIKIDKKRMAEELDIVRRKVLCLQAQKEGSSVVDKDAAGT